MRILYYRSLCFTPRARSWKSKDQSSEILQDCVSASYTSIKVSRRGQGEIKIGLPGGLTWFTAEGMAGENQGEEISVEPRGKTYEPCSLSVDRGGLTPRRR
jgi:hypothetical protein